jgi:predicted Ser/Thr protein kinase
MKWLRGFMLRNEYRVYKKLLGFRGSPRCYGLLRSRYLVLEYVNGVPIRHAEIADRQGFFDQLLEYIRELHDRGIAHTDLKRQDNLMVIDRRVPCLIDFGAAVLRKPGFAPVNHYLYDLARKFDYNAWVKLKYQGHYENVSAEDRVYYNRTKTEKLARWIKTQYTRIKRRFVN